jgi:hypothetical protein
MGDLRFALLQDGADALLLGALEHFNGVVEDMLVEIYWHQRTFFGLNRLEGHRVSELNFLAYTNSCGLLIHFKI